MTRFDGPVPTEVAVARKPRRRRRLPWSTIVLLVVAANVTGLFAAHQKYLGLFADFRGINRIVYWPGPPGSTIYIDPEHGWTVQFPDSWHAQRIRNIVREDRYTLESHGVFTANMPGVSDPGWEAAVVPSESVSVRVAYDYGGGFGRYCNHDTPLPLSLNQAKPEETEVRDDTGAPVRHLVRRFSIQWVAQYTVKVWIGSRASAEDLATAESIAASVYYNPPPPPSYLRVSGCESGV